MRRTIALVVDRPDATRAQLEAMLAPLQGQGFRPLARACEAVVSAHIGTLATAPDADLFLWLQRYRDEHALAAAAGDRGPRTVIADLPVRVCRSAQAIRGLGGVDSIELEQWLDGAAGHAPHSVIIAARRELVPRWTDDTTEVNASADYVVTYCARPFPEAMGAYLRVASEAGLLDR